MRGPVYQPVDETTLIERTLAGEPDAFRFLVHRYQNLIYSLMMRQVGNSALAQDLTQDTFVKCFAALPRFEHRSSFKTWLTRIAMNTASSYFQSRAYKNAQATQQLEIEDIAGSSEPLEDKERSLSTLHHALGKLDPKFREVVVLCKLEGKSYQEAADLLQISPGTVGSRLNVAQHQLRRLFWRMYR